MDLFLPVDQKHLRASTSLSRPESLRLHVLSLWLNAWKHKDKGRPRGRLHSDAQVNLRARKHQTLYVTLGNLRDSAWQDVNSVPMWCLSESALAAQTCFDQRSGFNVTYASLFTLNIRKRARLIIVPSFSEMSLIASSSSSSPLAFSLRIPEPSSYLIKVMWFK